MLENNINFMDVMQRIAIIIETNTGVAPSDKQIAQELRQTPSQYANNKKRNKIPYQQIVMFCDENEITINWVLLGKSSMKLIETEEGLYKIRLIEKINASCGGGGFDDEEVGFSYIFINKKYAKTLGITNSKNIEAINVVGDSMIPTIQDNSIIFIDRLKNTYENNGVYVLNTINGLFVKRLLINDAGDVELISDNKSYSNIPMKLDDVEIIGKVIGSLDKVS